MAQWMISSSVLTALVIALRFAVRGRVSLRLQYALWLIVLIRLLLPLSLGSSAISVANAIPAGDVEIAEEFLPSVENPDVEQQGSTTAPETAENAKTSEPYDWHEAAFAVWITGACALFIWFAAVNLRLWRTLRRSRRRFRVENY